MKHRNPKPQTLNPKLLSPQVLGEESRRLALLTQGLPSLPLLFLFLLSMRVFAHAAALTEKCRSIPAFVNQIPTQGCCDPSRQYLVHFIADSAAGFTVLNMKVTAEMLVRQASFFSSVLSCLLGVLSTLL
ncbi:unnamed protein product [Symbiodinium natans]|uniref:Uncharacterized protein n=1 Tax=Symbiodinium natans TaxID=878477 RepID=A0A812UIY8_9DINO|nr:unnamed protein product [Symbiodinium natans]